MNSRHASLPDGLLVAFYGDDFTGSTDEMEVMAFSGLPTVLFVREPDAAMLDRFRSYRCIGIAGIARGCSPAWMDAHLPRLLKRLFSLKAPITHYKVCSTFDSSPTVGSIGHVIDMALPMAAESWSPLVVAAPQLRRWQAFGNLFAGVDGLRYRLDRHPTMSRHPMTPMGEADLTRHLGLQTTHPSTLIDLVDLASGHAEVALQTAINERKIVSFDVIDESTQQAVGGLIWRNRGAGLFAASSSGLLYALVAHWREAGLIGPVESAARPVAPSVDRLLVLSGSCSPATAAQVDHAIASGFSPCRIDSLRIADAHTRDDEIDRVFELANAALTRSEDTLVFSAQSPDDPAIEALRVQCARMGTSMAHAQQAIGEALGEIGRRLTERHVIERLVCAGGDTSGRIIGSLPIDALEAVFALERGAPICRVHASDPRFDGMELVLKGGQVGDADFFVAAKRGHR